MEEIKSHNAVETTAKTVKTKKKLKKSKTSKRVSPLLVGIIVVLLVVVVLLAIVVVVQINRIDSKSEAKPAVEAVQSVPTTSHLPAGVYPFTSQRKVTYDDIAHLSARELRIMRNEIYARHGYIFNSKDLRNYFLNQGWYVPVSTDVEQELSAIERYNVNFIKQYE